MSQQINLNNKEKNQLYELLTNIANSIDCTIVTYSNIDNFMKEDIIINKFIDTSSYITKKEQDIINQKTKYL